MDADSSKDSTAGAESKKAQDGADKEMVSVTKKSSARVEEGKKHQDFLPEGSGGGHLMSREKLKYLRYFRLITHRKKNGKKGNKKNKKCLYYIICFYFVRRWRQVEVSQSGDSSNNSRRRMSRLSAS